MVVVNNPQLPDFANRYIMQAKVSEESRYIYSQNIKKVVDYIANELQIDSGKLKFEDVLSGFSMEKYCKEMLDAGYSKATVVNDLKSFYFMCNHVARREIFSIQADIPFFREDVIRPISNQEYTGLMEEISEAINTSKSSGGMFGSRDAVIIMLLRDVGIRISECCRLNVEDIQDGKLYLPRLAPKAIVLSEELNNLIQIYLSDRTDLVSNSNLLSGHGPLFISMQRKRMTIRSMEYLVRRRFDDDSHVTPKEIRKVCAIRRYLQTKDISFVSSLLGIKEQSVYTILSKIRENEDSLILM